MQGRLSVTMAPTASSDAATGDTSPLRILYAVQGTGNGHVARARDLIPRLAAHPELDVTVWLSGTQSEVMLPVRPAEQFPGISLLYNRHGGLSYSRTLRRNPWLRFVRDVWRAPVHGFDLIINDFEPVSAWAARLRRAPLLEISHQAGVRHTAAPRPHRRRASMEALLRWYAPSREAIGLHFTPVADDVLPPVIRDEIRTMPQDPDGRLLVYLPAHGPAELLAAFADAPVPVVAFTQGEFAPVQRGAAVVEPIHTTRFLSAFARASSVLCAAGFELPAEALHHGKRLAVIPIRGQYEQACNAAAAAQVGAWVAPTLTECLAMLPAWLASPPPAPADYPPVSEWLVTRIVAAARQARAAAQTDRHRLATTARHSETASPTAA